MVKAIRVNCAACGRSVPLEKGDFLARHKRHGGVRCDGSGRHVSFNVVMGTLVQPKPDMHEPPAYPASSLQFDDDSLDHLHPFTD